jgi:hypothetical protein
MGFAEFIIGPAEGRTRWLSDPPTTTPRFQSVNTPNTTQASVITSDAPNRNGIENFW